MERFNKYEVKQRVETEKAKLEQEYRDILEDGFVDNLYFRTTQQIADVVNNDKSLSPVFVNLADTIRTAVIYGIEQGKQLIKTAN